MSVKILGLVLDSTEERQGHLLVLIALADMCDNGGWCYPGVKYIAERSRHSERQTQRILHDLEHEGVLEITPGVGPKGTSGYQLGGVIMSPPGDVDGAGGGDVGGSEGVTPVSPNPLGDPSGKEPSSWEAPGWFLPLTELQGYRRTNHDRAATSIFAACSAQSVDAIAIAVNFAADWPSLKVRYHWNDPVAVLSRPKILRIQIDLLKNPRQTRLLARADVETDPAKLVEAQESWLATH